MFWYILYGTIALVFLFHLLTKKYLNPYTFSIVFGKKGSGKSCFMQKDLIKHHKRGWNCYADSNTNLSFVTKIDATKIFEYEFPSKSFVTIDEISQLFDGRNYKDFDLKVADWFREQRKKKVKIVGYTHKFDSDKRLRDMCDYLIVQRKFLRVFTFRRKYVTVPCILNSETTRDYAKTVDDIKRIPILFGGIDFAYIPKYIKCYDTNEQKTDKLALYKLSPNAKNKSKKKGARGNV